MRSWLLSCVLFAGCAPAAPAPVTRLRLWADTPGELRPAPPAAAATEVFASRFEDGPEQGLANWESIVSPGRGPGGLVASIASEDGLACLDLHGVHGGLHVVVPVEPSTCYVFRGRLRTLELEPAQESFDGARFWLAQGSAEAGFQEFRTTRIDLMTEAWSSPGIFGQAGWQDQRRVFVTTPETHFLHLVCALSTKDDVRAGGVRFAQLALEKHALGDFWQETLAHASAARARIDPPAPAGLAERRVAAELRGETRPALVLLPHESLRFRLPAWSGEARLAFALGPWPPVLAGTRGGRATLNVRDGTRELASTTLELPSEADEARWRELELPLAPFVGERVLEFTLEGAGPLVLGAPIVRTSAALPVRPNVLLISIDTLRADHVGAYGAAGNPTPNLDRLAADGLLCRDTSSQAPYTLPSHATLLTGQFPSVHGVVAHESTLSAARSTSLAELLARAGYRTRAFTSGGFVNAAFGLDQGFEAFSEIDPIRTRDSHYFRTLAKKHGAPLAAELLAEQGFEAVSGWLRARTAEPADPFLLFLHTYTVHDYDGPRRLLACSALGCSHPQVLLRTETSAQAEAYTPEMRAHIRHLYDGALRYTDERLGELFALLRELGLYDNTLIVVTSDHGEEFFEHGALQHGRTLYEELLRVPLLLAGPGIPARELAEPAMLIDVAPTILARLGLAPPPHAQGLDLLGSRRTPRPIWSEVDTRFAHKYALRAPGGTKTIHGPHTPKVLFPNERAWEFYDLGRDPAEQHDLGRAPSTALEAERAALEAQRRELEKLGESLGAAAHGEVDASTIEDLDGLGYGGGSEAPEKQKIPNESSPK